MFKNQDLWVSHLMLARINYVKIIHLLHHWIYQIEIHDLYLKLIDAILRQKKSSSKISSEKLLFVIFIIPKLASNWIWPQRWLGRAFIGSLLHKIWPGFGLVWAFIGLLVHKIWPSSKPADTNKQHSLKPLRPPYNVGPTWLADSLFNVDYKILRQGKTMLILLTRNLWLKYYYQQ